MVREHLHNLWLRLKAVVKRRQLDRDLAEELEFHLAMREQKLIEQGMPPREAHYAARRGFGNAVSLKERSRDQWSFPSLESLLQDVRYGLRQLRRSPGFTAVAIFTLALGIGANTTMFTLINAAFLKKLPVERPDELVMPETGLWGEFHDPFDYPTLTNLRGSQTLAGVCGNSVRTMSVEVNGQSELVLGQYATGNFYTLLGVRPFLGRLLLDSDDGLPSGHAVAVISHRFWKRRFGGDPSVMGRTIRINTVPFEIVGVEPEEFHGVNYGYSSDITIPVTMLVSTLPGADLMSRGPWLNLFGRLKPGFSKQQAEAEVVVLVQRSLQQAFAVKPELHDTYTGGVRLVRGNRGLNWMDDYSHPGLIISYAAALLLMITCVNLANLMLARTSARGHEIGVRLSLGASRRRLVRQLLTESLLLSLTGGLMGIAFAHWGVHSLLAFIPSDLGLFIVAPIDLRVLAFVLGASCLTGVMFGITPALQGTKADVWSILKENVRLSSRGVIRTRQAMIVAQVALTMVLLTGTSLLIRSLANLKAVNPGFQSENVVQADLTLEYERYKPEQMKQLYSQLLDRVRAMPSVNAAGLTFNAILGDNHDDWRVAPVDESPGGHESKLVSADLAGPGSFNTLGIPLLAGREFDARDNEHGAHVAVINRAAARELFGVDNPLGRRFRTDNFKNEKLAGFDDWEVVGVVADTKYYSLRESPPATIFLPFDQLPWVVPMRRLYVRSQESPAQLIPALKREISSLGARVPVIKMHTFAAQRDESLVKERAVSTLAGFFSSVALLLGCMGLYGITAYMVTRRRHEIAIRVALGARPRQVLSLVLKQTGVLLIVGVTIGSILAAGSTRLFSALLYGVGAAAVETFAGPVVAILIVMAAATVIPARRAVRIDPAVALRDE
jgi:predicted permease